MKAKSLADAMNQEFPLDLIRLDGGTQQRQIDDAVVKSYVALIKDGVRFPPIDLVFDGENHWLWDGFHRVECALKLGRKTIMVNITSGTQRDAIWFSFSANKDHGLPRQAGVAKHIIEQILTDESWSKKTLTNIAKHVGVTRQYVTKIRDGLSVQSAPSGTVDEGKPASEAKNEEKGATGCTLLRGQEVEVQSSRGTTYTQRSQEKEDRPQESLKDSVGQVIPDHLIELYRSRSAIQTIVNDLAKIKKAVTQELDARNPVFAMLKTGAFASHYANLRGALRAAIPHALCCYCGGDSNDCQACGGFGFLNKHSYDAAPREMKP